LPLPEIPKRLLPSEDVAVIEPVNETVGVGAVVACALTGKYKDNKNKKAIKIKVFFNIIIISSSPPPLLIYSYYLP
jgi:hypothetical protein